MATPIYCCGFECGRASTSAIGAHVATLATNWSFSTATVRNGARSLRHNPTAGSGIQQINNFSASSAVHVVRFGLYFTTLPNATTGIMRFDYTASAGGVVFQASDSKIYAGTDIGGVFTLGATGVAVTTGVWYYIDLLSNATANTIDVQVSGVVCGQYSNAVTVTGNGNFPYAGDTVSITADYFIDDFIWSQTAADYPLGDGHVDHFVPTADGTHNVAGAADFRRGDTTTDITNATTTAYQLIDDVPLDDVTPDADDHIRIVAPPNNTDYVECIFGPAPGISTPTDAPRAVEAIAEVFAAGTGASDEIINLRDTTANGVIYDGTGVAGVVTGTYKRKHFAARPNGGAWTAAALNGIRVRYGYATDANPDKSLMCIMLEAEFAVVAAEFDAATTAAYGGIFQTGQAARRTGVVAY